MKLKYLLLFTLLTITSYTQQQKYFQIEKNNQGGFNIYSNSGELLYEYTLRNCDSLTLKTLDDIFIKADSKNNIEVPIINLQEKGFDYSNIIIAVATLLGTLGGLYLGNRLSKITQLDYYRRTVEVERKKEWIANLKNYFAEHIKLTHESSLKDSFYQLRSLKLSGQDEIDYENKHYENFSEIIAKQQEILTKIALHLNMNNPKQKALYDEFNSILDNINKIFEHLRASSMTNGKGEVYSFASNYYPLFNTFTEKIRAILNDAEEEIIQIQLAKSDNIFSKIFSSKKQNIN